MLQVSQRRSTLGDVSYTLVHSGWSKIIEYLTDFIAGCKNFVSVSNGKESMVNYKVTNYTAPISNPSKQVADVVEIETGQVIKSGVPTAEARELCRSLNFGNGFDGKTPAFFLEKCKGLVFEESDFYK